MKGIPLRIEKNKKTGGIGVVVSVPETTEQKSGYGKYKITKQIPTGKHVEKIVPYAMNEDRIFKGKLKFTTDEIDKGLSENGVQVKKSDSNKHVIKGKEYSDEAVAKAAKASGMSVEEYLKEANK